MQLNTLFDVVMPIEEGRFILEEVLTSLLNQGFPIRLWVSTKFCDRRMAEARNNIKQYANTDLFLMLDNDAIMPSHALSNMYQFMASHANFAGIALSKNRKFSVSDEVVIDSHIDMSCVLFQKNNRST